MTLRRIRLPRRGAARRGSALIVVMVVVLMLIGLVGSITMTATARSAAAIERRGRAQAMGAAESGIALTLEKIIQSKGDVLATDDAATITASPKVYEVPGGQVTVTTVEMAKNGLDDDASGEVDDDGEAGVVRVHARATIGQGSWGVTRTLEAFLVTQQHEAFYKAVFVGNDTDTSGYVLNFGPGNGNPRAPANDRPQRQRDGSWDTLSHSQNADYVEGDVYVNGTLQVTGQSDVFGDIDTTGALVGRPTSGTTSEGVDRISVPDLAAQDYESIADIVVDANTATLPSFMRDEERESYYGSTLGAATAHDRPYFHLGDHDGQIDIQESDSGKLVYVKGNLWIHSTKTLDAVFPGSRDAHVTLVVEGNVYVADDVQYDGAEDGLLIIAKGKEGEESFTDENLNYRWDAGEPILNDDGDGVYQGPREGQGNVYFGDPRFGTGGVTDGYLYAQNNVYLVNRGTELDRPDDRVWGVKGFLSAGNQMHLGDRKGGRNFENFRVKYDERFRDLSFKGVPGPTGGDAFAGLVVASWRELPAGAD